jgi:hypothetical protein
MVAMAARVAQVIAVALLPIVVVAIIAVITIVVIAAVVATLRLRPVRRLVRPRPVPLRPARPLLPRAVPPLPRAAPAPPLRMLLRPLPRRPRRPRLAPASCSARRCSASPFVSNCCQPIWLADFCEWKPALSFSTRKSDTPKPDLSMGSGFFFFPGGFSRRPLGSVGLSVCVIWEIRNHTPAPCSAILFCFA